MHGAETIDVPVQPISATLEINSHLEADSLDMTFDYLTAGVDPRLLHNATVLFYMGNSKDASGNRTALPLRFTGVCDTVERHGGEGQASRVTMRFLDYTTFFLKNKNYPTAGIPSFDETLPQIWQKICDHTGYYDITSGTISSSVAELRDRIVLFGVDASRKLSATATARMTRFGTFVVRQGDSAWDIWLRAVGAMGLISWIELDEVIVSPTTEHFSEGRAPRFVLGDNISEWSEKVDASISDKGVGIQSLNTVTGQLLESFYPPPGDPRIHLKRSKAKKKAGQPVKPATVDFQSDHYDMYEMHDIADQSALDRIAQRAYAERCRQEVQGVIKTSEMHIDDFDLLSLKAGDNIRVELSANYEELLRSFGDTYARVNYLTSRGIDDRTAALIAKNVDALPALKPIYHVKRCRTTLEDTGDSGRFEVEIHYHNKIEILGNTDDSP